MRTFFGEILCECESIDLVCYALSTPDDTMEVSELRILCIDCTTVFHDVVDRLDERELKEMDAAPREVDTQGVLTPGSYSEESPHIKDPSMATVKKAATPTTRGRNQDRAQVATMEDYEVKYLATKHSVTQKAVKEAVAKVGHSRNKVEAELKKGKASTLPAKRRS